MEDDLRWREGREKRLAQRKENQAADADAAGAQYEEGEGDDEALDACQY